MFARCRENISLLLCPYANTHTHRLPHLYLDAKTHFFSLAPLLVKHKTRKPTNFPASCIDHFPRCMFRVHSRKLLIPISSFSYPLFSPSFCERTDHVRDVGAFGESLVWKLIQQDISPAIDGVLHLLCSLPPSLCFKDSYQVSLHHNTYKST